MAYVTAEPEQPHPWYIKLVLVWARWTGRVLPEPVLLWLRLPMAFVGFQLMWRALEGRHSKLPATLRALLRTRVAQLNHCRFCIDLNASHALQRGVAPEVLEQITDYASSTQFSAAEKAALAYTDAVTASGAIDPELIAGLQAHFSEDAIVEMTAVIAHQNLSAKFNAGLAPAGYCAIRTSRH